MKKSIFKTYEFFLFILLVVIMLTIRFNKPNLLFCWDHI